MHIESLLHMKLNIDRYVMSGTDILDVGSLNVKNKGCYKNIVDLNKHSYLGIDTVSGNNVDLVVPPYKYPFKNDTFGAVISGQCFEHSENPFNLMKECARVLKPGGYFIGVAPYKWPEHRHPVDCWRILADGWKALFNEAGLTCVNTYYTDIEATFGDSWGIAVK